MTRPTTEEIRHIEEASVFREWSAHAPNARRSTMRTAEIAQALGITLSEVAPLQMGVVGSKGKGTAAIYAAATFSATGCRTVLITSPGYRSNLERIRLDGMTVDPNHYVALLGRLAQALELVPRVDADYLSPTGAFMLLGAMLARDVSADALVVEAGMGGRSDDLSRFYPSVVAVTPIFEEHLGVLGNSLEEIAREKLGVAGSSGKVISAPQRTEVLELLGENNLARVLDVEASPVAERVLPPGLGRINAVVGVVAALARLAGAGHTLPRLDSLERVLETVDLPGRLTSIPGRKILVDASINRTGLVGAITHFQKLHGMPPKRFVMSIPDGKDLNGVLAELEGCDVSVAVPQSSYLKFTNQGATPFSTVDVQTLPSMDDSGGLLVFGTVSFVGEVLESFDHDCRRVYRLP
jgi:folylpolyglutamate synthase/dihydropteroate synthase